MKIVPVIILVYLTITSRSNVVPDDLRKFVVANHKFTADIFKKLAELDTDNMVTSPLALQLIMALIMDGTRNQTVTELKDALHLRPLLQNLAEYKDFFTVFTHCQRMNFESFKLLYANSIYYDRTVRIRSLFSNYAEKTFNVKMQRVDFSKNVDVAKQINKWVNKTTAGEIDYLIDETHIAPGSKLVLVNNLYFQWAFKNPFLSKFTKSGVFYTSPSNNMTTDFLRSYRNASYSYNRTLNTKFLELPFVNDLDEFYIVFVLPGSTSGINMVENNLGEYLETQTLQTKSVAIIVPKFSFNNKINYRPTLKTLGVNRLFDPQSAPLTLVSETKGIAVDKILQKSTISLSEIGIAVGATKIEPGGVPLATNPEEEYQTFYAEHPFLFYIKHASGEILLVGKVTEPLEAYKKS